MGELSRRLRGTALVAALVLLTLLAAPGTASAAGTGVGTVPTGTITPLLDCIKKESNGSVTALLGYTSSARTAVTIARGQLNQLSPSRLTGAQPTTFQPGTKHGAFAVTITNAEYMNGAYWWVDGNVTYFDWPRTQQGPYCAPGTTLPAAGNGTGIAIALLAAGVVGALAVRSLRRAVTRGPGAPAPA
jgi:hypothetical protein